MDPLQAVHGFGCDPVIGGTLFTNGHFVETVGIGHVRVHVLAHHLLALGCVCTGAGGHRFFGATGCEQQGDHNQ